MTKISEVGDEYLCALESAKQAGIAVVTNDGDSYDPTGDTARRVKREYDLEIERLARATKALIALAPETP